MSHASKGVQEPYVLKYRQSRGEVQGVEDIDEGSSRGYMDGGEIDPESSNFAFSQRKNPVWPRTGKK